MVKIKHFALAAALMTAGSTFGQINTVNRLPEVQEGTEQKVYRDNNTGFWIAAEAAAGYSCRMLHSNFTLTEIDVTGGYRFSEFLKVGLGLGARYYIDNDNVRWSTIKWSFPIYANVRGNFIPTMERNVVPYWSVDLGGAIRDGFMIRPTVGLRIGQERSAFLVGLAYTGQDLKSYDLDRHGFVKYTRRFASFITLRLGYEF